MGLAATGREEHIKKWLEFKAKINRCFKKSIRQRHSEQITVNQEASQKRWLLSGALKDTEGLDRLKEKWKSIRKSRDTNFVWDLQTHKRKPFGPDAFLLIGNYCAPIFRITQLTTLLPHCLQHSSQPALLWEKQRGTGHEEDCFHTLPVHQGQLLYWIGHTSMLILSPSHFRSLFILGVHFPFTLWAAQARGLLCSILITMMIHGDLKGFWITTF